ncbi:MAG: MgtC/SapB family protein [Clostridia bacterium]|nr:MgtC/SapB family protein [Clostridia bacterium]
MLVEMMNQHVNFSYYLEFFIRIVLSCVCGAVIGLERSRRLKEAGVRTHLLVSCTAALMMIVSKYGFADMMNAEGVSFFGIREADPARIAAQVVSGISFLCAGVIFKQGSMVKGLTTAAGMWATSGVGLALGAGMYLLGIIATVLIVLLQFITHRLPIVNDQYQNNRIEIVVEDDGAFHSVLMKRLKAWQAQVVESKISRNKDGTTSYTMLVKMSTNVKEEEIYSFLDQNSNIVTFSRTINV